MKYSLTDEQAEALTARLNRTLKPGHHHTPEQFRQRFMAEDYFEEGIDQVREGDMAFRPEETESGEREFFVVKRSEVTGPDQEEYEDRLAGL